MPQQQEEGAGTAEPEEGRAQKPPPKVATNGSRKKERKPVEGRLVTRNTFVARALKRIHELCGSGRKWGVLKEACADVLNYLQQPPAKDEDEDSVMSFFFVPLRLAAETRTSKMIELSFECLQKLMEYSFITGRMIFVPPKTGGKWLAAVKAWMVAAEKPDKRTGERKYLIYHVISVICANSSFHHDGVQLRIITSLLAAVSTPSCEVHGSALVNAVRTTYNIFLISYNVTNQTTAKATLNHMINIVFQRMEASCTSDTPSTAWMLSSDRSKLKRSTPVSTPTTEPRPSFASPASAVTVPCADDELTAVTATEDLEGLAGEDMLCTADDESGGDWIHGMVQDIIARVVGEEIDDAATTVTTVTTDDRDVSFDFSRAVAEKAAEKAAASSRPANGAAPPTSTTSAASTDRAFFSADDTDRMEFQNQLQKDAFLLFHSLCKLSVKQVPEHAAHDSLEMKSKLLSLELLLNLLIKSGTVFRTSERFIQAVKQNLCMSLLQNCVSPLLAVFRMSLYIFLSLISNFKDHLKREIGVFFTNVFLAILESSNSSFQQKMLVIQVLHKICENPQTIIDIFVNYDCDLESLNIFESMVNLLSRTLQVRHTGDTPKQDIDMKILALRTLVMILSSMVQWTEKFTDEDKRAGASTPPPPEVNGTVEPVVTTATSSSTSPPSRAIATPSQSEQAPDDLSLREGEDAGDEFERARARKKEMEELVAAFNKEPREGLRLMFQSGVVEEEPRAVALLLREMPGLDKNKIGDYLARSKDFESKTLNEFIDSFDFSGLEIDEAVRRFLSAFRISGEAQVIDRTMEKFAEKFTKDNQATFPNASTAYVLSFSIIMLNTDSHSAHINEKMTKEQFVRNNRGIDDGKDLSESFLGAIYDRVTAKPFALEGEKAPTKPSERRERRNGVLDTFIWSDGKRKAMNYMEETQQMLKRTRELFQSTKGEGQMFFKANKLEHVKPMFLSAWAAILPAFSVLLEQCDNDHQEMIDYCLRGFALSIHISCLFYLDTPRDAFVSALSKLTFLNNHREIEEKNIKSIKTLIDIATKEGNYLRESWYAVLRSISYLERLQLLGSGAKPDFAFLDEKMDKMGKKIQQKETKLRNLEVQNSQIIADHIDETAISRIYSSTVELSGEAIVYFVQNLCQVSLEEIEQSTPVRMFSLQKLIEVADINMGRIRFVWSQLWQHMAKHFNSVGTNTSLSVSMFGIDSLRQLSMKFLEKRELTNYHFQRDFLKPFETILQNSRSIEIREFIVRCLSQMVSGRATHIKSGWKSIFAVFSHAAADSNEQIIILAFDTVDQIITKLLSLVVVADAFPDTVNCLIAFGLNELSPSISVRAISHLETCSDVLIRGVPTPDAPDETRFIVPTGAKVSADDRAQLCAWLPILSGFCAETNQHPNLKIRLRALEGLFSVLNRHGGSFAESMWKRVLARSIIPIFDNALCDLALHVTTSTPSEFGASIVEIGLAYLIDLFSNFYEDLRPLLGDFMKIITDCIKTPVLPKVAAFGVRAFLELVCTHSVLSERQAEVLPEKETLKREINPDHFFTPAEWKVVVARLHGLCSVKFPLQLITARKEGEELFSDLDTTDDQERRPLSTRVMEVHLETLLVLLQAMDKVLDKLDLPLEERSMWLSCFEVVHRNAQRCLKESDIAHVRTLEELVIDCEHVALQAHLQQHIGREGLHDSMLDVVYEVLTRYCAVRDQQPNSHRRKRLGANAIAAINTLLEIPPDNFTRCIPRFYPLLLEMIKDNLASITAGTYRYFARIGELHLAVNL